MNKLPTTETDAAFFCKRKEKNVVNTKYIKCKKYVNLTENNKHSTVRHKGIFLKYMQM